MIDNRHLCAVAVLTAMSAGFASSAIAATKSHGLTILSQLKYPANFKNFEYVNPDAPKGGRMASYGGLNFDNFNPFILKGTSATGLGLLFDSLLESSADEPDAAYGLVAHSVELSDDKMSVTFFMRPEAKFSDGTPVTADDVVYTFETLKKDGHPVYRFRLRGVDKAEAIDKHTVRFSFKGKLARDLPITVATLPIISKKYYETVDFKRTTLVPPLGSGPYKLAAHQANSFVRFTRRKDYWAKDLPVNRGRYNFDELTFRYYKNRDAAFLGFTSGEYDMHEEFTSKRWATSYNFPAIKDGRVKLLTLPDNTPSGTQGWFLNTRRAKFSDPRVRRALGFAF